MKVETYRKKTSVMPLVGLVLVMVAFTIHVLIGLSDSAMTYEYVQAEVTKPMYGGSVAKTELADDTSINIPTWELFTDGSIWSLVSAQQQLSEGFTPDDLTDLEVPHGDQSTPMKVQQQIVPRLTELFEAAEADGYGLMISSAYRSVTDQQQLYNTLAFTRGVAYADEYVAVPGGSEHHTGLAVDFSTFSDDCALDSNACSLGADVAAWLENNAYRYGFVLRYPDGKQDITGITYEPWHYRYVGIPLANILYATDLTLDEALAKMYPAFSSR